MNRDSRMFVSVAFGYVLIFNLIGTNRYNMYPAWVLVFAALGIGIFMVAASIWAFTRDVKPKHVPEVISVPDKFTRKAMHSRPSVSFG